MVEISFTQSIGAAEVKQIREAVQKECFSLKIPPKNAFIILFVVDELACNIMEHAHATWMELSVDVRQSSFSAVLKDDGVPFDAGQEISEAKDNLSGHEGERKLGLSLIGRLVDKVEYSRTGGKNRINLEKEFATS